MPGAAMAPGDVLVIETPGGGGYGRRRLTPGEARASHVLPAAAHLSRLFRRRSTALRPKPTRNPTTSHRISISHAGSETHQKKK